jgi:hypothetical protein
MSPFHGYFNTLGFTLKNKLIFLGFAVDVGIFGQKHFTNFCAAGFRRKVERRSSLLE